MYKVYSFCVAMPRVKGAKGKNPINKNPRSIRLEVGSSVFNLINDLSSDAGKTSYLLNLVRQDAKNRGIDPDLYGLTADRVMG
jgi:hypothetical protein